MRFFSIEFGLFLAPELRWWGRRPPSPPRRCSSPSPPSSSSSSSSSSLTRSKKSPSSSCWRAGSVLLSLCHCFVFKTFLKLAAVLAILDSWQNQCWLQFLEVQVLALLDSRFFRFVFPCFPSFYLAIVDGIPIEQIGNLKIRKICRNRHKFKNILLATFFFFFSKDIWLERHVDESCTTNPDNSSSNSSQLENSQILLSAQTNVIHALAADEEWR